MCNPWLGLWNKNAYSTGKLRSIYDCPILHGLDTDQSVTNILCHIFGMDSYSYQSQITHTIPCITIIIIIQSQSWIGHRIRALDREAINNRQAFDVQSMTRIGLHTSHRFHSMLIIIIQSQSRIGRAIHGWDCTTFMTSHTYVNQNHQELKEKT